MMVTMALLRSPFLWRSLRSRSPPVGVAIAIASTSSFFNSTSAAHDYYSSTAPHPTLLHSQYSTMASSPSTSAATASVHGTTGKPPHVLIIGGGIGGLCLAQGLKRHGIAFTVFERDESPMNRHQGFRLRISGGFEPLQKCLPPHVFDLIRGTSATFVPGFSFLNAETCEKVSPKGPPGAGPPRGRGGPPSDGDVNKVMTVDRATLRTALTTGLTAQELRFGMVFKEFVVEGEEGNEKDTTGSVTAVFENGERVTGTLLVAADGTNSRVRLQYVPQVTQLLDTDGRAVYGKTKLTPELEAALPAFGSTTLITHQTPLVSLFLEPIRFSESARVARDEKRAHHLPEIVDFIYWVLIARSSLWYVEGATNDKALAVMTAEEMARHVSAMTSHWDPRLQALFAPQHHPQCAFTRVSSMSPEIKSWQASRVTLLGDAIHAMTPAGVGANIALEDAELLLRNLLEHGVNKEAVGKYESEMRQYASEAVAATAGAGRKMYGQPPFEEMKAL